MSKFNWNDAPEWAVDVRQDSVQTKFWTDGMTNCKLLTGGASWTSTPRFISRIEVIETRPEPFGFSVGYDLNTMKMFEKGTPLYAQPDGSSTPLTNAERLAGAISEWPTTIRQVEALAKSGTVSKSVVVWLGSEIKSITIDGVTKEEWLDAITLSEQDMIKLAGRDAARAFQRKAIATAHAFDDWSTETDNGLTFSTFINTFGYQDKDGKQMYEAVKRIYNAGARFVK